MTDESDRIEFISERWLKSSGRLLDIFRGLGEVVSGTSPDLEMARIIRAASTQTRFAEILEELGMIDDAPAQPNLSTSDFSTDLVRLSSSLPVKASKLEELAREGRTRGIVMNETRDDESMPYHYLLHGSPPEKIAGFMKRTEAAHPFSQLMHLLDLWEGGALGVKDKEQRWHAFDPATAQDLSHDGILYQFTDERTPAVMRGHFSKKGMLTDLSKAQVRETMEAFFGACELPSLVSFTERFLEEPEPAALRALAGGKKDVTIDVTPQKGNGEGRSRR